MSATDLDAATLVRVSTDGSALTLTPRGRAPVTAHALWLRDRCNCPTCRRPTTNERLLDQADLDPATAIRAASIAPGDILEVVFDDGHSWSGRVDEVLAPLTADLAAPMDGRTRWPIEGFAAFDRHSLYDDTTLLTALDRVRADGAVLVTGADPTDEGLRGVAQHIGPIQPTNYGATWSFEASVDPVSEVESMRGLRVHTDLPYRAQPAGVQLNLAVCDAVDGGASTFVDGYSMAEVLRAEDERAWRLLTTTHFEYPYHRAHVRLCGGGPLVGLTGEGRYGIVRRAPDLVGVPRVAAEDAADLYRVIRRWGELVDDPANQVHVHLRPGELVIFDNHRLLHGRTPFTLRPGERRHLIGCYLEMDELQSRAALLREATGS